MFTSYWFWRGQRLSKRANKKMDKSKFNGAIKVYSKALKCFYKLDEKYQMMQILEKMGDCYKNLDDIKKYRSCYKMAEQYYKSLDSSLASWQKR